MTTAPVNGLRTGRAGRIPPTHWIAVFFVIALGLIPLTLALLRLWAVTGIGPVEALFTIHQQPGAMDALRFSMLEAFASTLLTVCLGLPIAGGFGRYRWRNLRTKRALLFLPFVTPPIVAAVGFLALLSPDGLIYRLGIDMRGETGFIGWISTTTGWEHPGHFVALVVAHVWFNLSLVVRFVEPVVAQLDPAWEEQLALLPSGQRKRDRFQHLWLPVLGPATLVAPPTRFFSVSPRLPSSNTSHRRPTPWSPCSVRSVFGRHRWISDRDEFGGVGHRHLSDAADARDAGDGRSV